MMAAFNTLHAKLTCPRCGWCGEVEVEFRFGLRDQLNYRLGDRLTWAGGARGKPLRRPEHGDLDGEGYVDCPNCGKDYWVDIRVRDDVLAGVQVDEGRSGYKR